MINFDYFRTESIKPDEILNLFVDNPVDRHIVDSFKSIKPTIIEGSRGIGKSFLMKVAFQELSDSFNEDRILPVYVTFRESSLLHSKRDANQFKHWMIAKIIRESLKELRKKGISVDIFSESLLWDGGEVDLGKQTNKLKAIIRDYENSFNDPEKELDTSLIPNIDDLLDAYEELCGNANISRICIFFDEAAHMFRPQQQRDFFSLYRELRSPYVSANAAVYPGVTHYGASFEKTHDTSFIQLERDINSPDYLKVMTQMVFNQLSNDDIEKIRDNIDYLNTLAFCASGNPRMLLTTISQASNWKTNAVEKALKEFYRDKIWAEHTQLGEKYEGHEPVVTWGRKFLEDVIIPETENKNTKRIPYNESTIYFQVHKDIPAIANEALRLLCYTGIIRKIGDGVKGSHSFIGTRYEIKYGCILAKDANPIKNSNNLKQHLTTGLVTEIGINNQSFNDLPEIELDKVQEEDTLKVVLNQLQKSIDVLDLPDWQKNRLKAARILTIENLLNETEEGIKDKIYMVGPVRSQKIYNVAIAELLEYISG